MPLTAMETSSKESQALFKRLIIYHCYRENKYAKGAATYLNKIYGKSFISEGAVQKWFKIFKDKEDDVHFDDLCQLAYSGKKKRCTKPVPADPPELDDEMEQELANGEAKSLEEKGSVKVKVKRTPAKPKKQVSSDGGEPDGNGSESENNTTNLDRCEKRKLILRCYKAEYSVGEANRYLNSIHGKGFINKTSVYTWYRRFQQKDFKLGDKNRSGRPQKVDETKGKEIIEYVEGNPSVNLRQIASQFKLSTGTLSRLLPKLGFQYVVDKWVKTEERPEVSDDQLKAFKEANPSAKVKEVAEHFMISRIIIAQRLRKLGFDIPKWPKKKKATGEQQQQQQQGGSADVLLGLDGQPLVSLAPTSGPSTRRGRPKAAAIKAAQQQQAQAQAQAAPQMGGQPVPGPEVVHLGPSTSGVGQIKVDFGSPDGHRSMQQMAERHDAQQQQQQQQQQPQGPPLPQQQDLGPHNPLSRINMEQLISIHQQQHSPQMNSNGSNQQQQQQQQQQGVTPNQIREIQGQIQRGPSPGHMETQQQYNNLMNLAQVTAVNSLLPAVLRRKPNALLQPNSLKGPPPPGHLNPMTGLQNEVRDLRVPPQMAENLSTNNAPQQQQQQQGPGGPANVIVTSNGYHMPPTSSLMASHVTHSGPYSSHGALQNLVVQQPSAGGQPHGSQQQQQQGQVQPGGPGSGQQGNPHGHTPDPLHNFDPYNAPPLDSIQVQNILHPYYQ